MATSSHAVPSSALKRGLKYLGLAVLGLIVLIAAIWEYTTHAIVPPMLVQVVDAVSGKPVSGLDVCLEAKTGGWGPRVVRSEIFRTGSTGLAFFMPSAHNTFLAEWEGYSVSVSDPRTNLGGPCLSAFDGRANPLAPFQPADLLPNSSGYFPIVLINPGDSRGDKPPDWSENRRPMGFPLVKRVSMIPILTATGDCQQVHDSELASLCGDLNQRSSAASSHLLPPFIGYARRSEVAVSYRNSSPAAGRRGYWTVYQEPGMSVPIAFSVFEYPGPEWKSDWLRDLPKAVPDYDPSRVTEAETAPGQKTHWIRNGQGSRVFWTSDRRLVLVTFLKPDAGVEEGFVNAALVDFPSDLQ